LQGAGYIKSSLGKLPFGLSGLVDDTVAENADTLGFDLTSPGTGV
jgi:hypothetical protein